MTGDEHNLYLPELTEAVDEVNSKFYGRFQFPQAPSAFDALADPSFERIMLNQSIGSWDHSIIPDKPRIWVAGCGTNQAVFVGLRFPNATIVASDLSATSIETSQRNAQQVGVKNVEFRQESINNATVQGDFDYVICTGVIHHNADPAMPLSKLAAALKPTGILELMVYNRYHRVMSTAFQKAMRLLAAGADIESELRMARKIADKIKIDNLMARFIKSANEKSEAEFADALLQPVEHSFTVESLESLLTGCGLELVAPCINKFDKPQGTFLWNMEFDDPEIATLYLSLTDADRWKISNHLMMERSPMLWFYCQRQDAGRRRVAEKELCQQFLELRFMPSNTRKKLYLISVDGRYIISPRLLDYPGVHSHPMCRKVIETATSQPGMTMGEIFRRLGIGENFTVINKLRLCLTTSEFPFLTSIDPHKR